MRQKEAQLCLLKHLVLTQKMLREELEKKSESHIQIKETLNRLESMLSKLQNVEDVRSTKQVRHVFTGINYACKLVVGMEFIDFIGTFLLEKVKYDYLKLQKKKTLEERIDDQQIMLKKLLDRTSHARAPPPPFAANLGMTRFSYSPFAAYPYWKRS